MEFYKFNYKKKKKNKELEENWNVFNYSDLVIYITFILCLLVICIPVMCKSNFHIGKKSKQTYTAFVK